MFCAKCGAVLKEGAKYCDYCGARAEEEPDGVPKFSETKKPKRRKKILIGASVAIAAFAVGVLAFALIALGGADKLRAGRQCQLGERYLEEMDYEAAIAAFKAAIEIEPREDAYIGLADAYVGLGDDASAIKALDEGIAKTGSASLRDYREKTQKEWEDKTRKIRGRVLTADAGTDAKDSDDAGIPGIEVLLMGEDGETIACYTDEDGYFDSGILSSGTYTVSFSKDGYVGQEREVEATGGGEADVDIYLEPDTGVLVREVRYNGEMTEIYRSEYEYDQSGRVIRETENSIYGSESGHRCEYEYDGEGNLAKKYSFDGFDLTERIDYEYDDDGNKIKETTYDRDGEVVDWRAYEYDEYGNVVKEDFYPIKFAGNHGLEEQHIEYQYKLVSEIAED